jgi:hypothetical protein
MTVSKRGRFYLSFTLCLLFCLLPPGVPVPGAAAQDAPLLIIAPDAPNPFLAPRPAAALHWNLSETPEGYLLAAFGSPETVVRQGGMFIVSPVRVWPGTVPFAVAP